MDSSASSTPLSSPRPETGSVSSPAIESVDVFKHFTVVMSVKPDSAGRLVWVITNRDRLPGSFHSKTPISKRDVSVESTEDSGSSKSTDKSSTTGKLNWDTVLSQKLTEFQEDYPTLLKLLQAHSKALLDAKGSENKKVYDFASALLTYIFMSINPTAVNGNQMGALNQVKASLKPLKTNSREFKQIMAHLGELAHPSLLLYFGFLLDPKSKTRILESFRELLTKQGNGALKPTRDLQFMHFGGKIISSLLFDQNSEVRLLAQQAFRSLIPSYLLKVEDTFKDAARLQFESYIFSINPFSLEEEIVDQAAVFKMQILAMYLIKKSNITNKETFKSIIDEHIKVLLTAKPLSKDTKSSIENLYKGILKYRRAQKLQRQNSRERAVKSKRKAVRKNIRKSKEEERKKKKELKRIHSASHIEKQTESKIKHKRRSSSHRHPRSRSNSGSQSKSRSRTSSVFSDVSQSESRSRANSTIEQPSSLPTINEPKPIVTSSVAPSTSAITKIIVPRVTPQPPIKEKEPKKE